MRSSKRRFLAVILACMMMLTLSAAPAYAQAEALGDYAAEGDAGSCEFDEEAGVLYVNGGEVTLRMADGVESTGQPIIVRGDAKITLDGVNIVSQKGPAILITAPYTAELVLAEGSENR